MTTMQNTFKFAFCGFLIATMLVVPLAIPTTVHAAAGVEDTSHDIPQNALTGVGDGLSGSQTGFSAADYALKILKEVGISLAKVLLGKLTESTVNWINGGFQGSPQFVSNPSSFFKGVGDTELKNVIDTIGYDDGKYPYGRQIAKSLIKNYISDNGDVASKAKFTLDTIAGPNWDKFQTDFKVGGWDTYSAYTQNPANNPFGSLFIGLDAAHTVVQKAHTDIQKEIDLGQGFLAQKTCTKYRDGPQTANDNTTVTTGGAQGALNNEHTFLSGGAKNDADCLEWKQLSPGSLVQSQITRAMGSKFNQNELGQALGNSISSIVNALANTLINKGLSALSTAISGDSNSTPKDTWQYQGYTLAGPINTSTTNQPSNWASGSDKIIDLQNSLVYGQEVGTFNSKYLPLSATQKATYTAQGYTFKDSTDTDGTTITTVYDPNSTAIALTQKESDMYKEMLDITQVMPAKIKTLDACLPGPDTHWDRKFDVRSQRITTKFQTRTSAKNQKKSDTAIANLEAINNAMDTLKSEIKLNVLQHNIPSYVLLSDLVKSSVLLAVKKSDYYDKYFDRESLIARLKSIKDQYNLLVDKTNPDALGPLLKQYAPLADQVSTDISITQATKTLYSVRYSNDRLLQGIQTCNDEKANPANAIMFTPPGSNVQVNAFGTDPLQGQTTVSTGLQYSDIHLAQTDRTSAMTELHNLIDPDSTFSTLSADDQSGFWDTVTNLTNEQFTAFYSIIKLNSAYAYFKKDDGVTAMTGKDLYFAAADWADEFSSDNLDVNTVTAQTSAELTYYCRQFYKDLPGQIKQGIYGWGGTVSTGEYLLKKGISCEKIYQGGDIDYRVDNQY